MFCQGWFLDTGAKDATRFQLAAAGNSATFSRSGYLSTRYQGNWREWPILQEYRDPLPLCSMGSTAGRDGIEHEFWQGPRKWTPHHFVKCAVGTLRSGYGVS